MIGRLLRRGDLVYDVRNGKRVIYKIIGFSPMAKIVQVQRKDLKVRWVDTIYLRLATIPLAERLKVFLEQKEKRI